MVPPVGRVYQRRRHAARSTAGALTGKALAYGADVRRVLAIDIGGTKLAAGVVDDAGTVFGAHRMPTAGDGPDGLFATLAGLVGAVRDAVGQSVWQDVAACGVGCGGPMAPAGEFVTPLNIPQWNGFPLRARLTELTGLRTWIDNDAKALALAEGRLGAAAGERDYVAMVVSTGVGGGIVVDGRLLDGATGNAGHIGHVIVEPEGRMCGCGARGCLEAEASGSAIRTMTGRPAADADAAVIARTGRLVGRGVASAVSLLDVRLAAIGGSVALGFGEPFFTAANEELAARCQIEFAVGARIVPSSLGPDGPLIGAALVAFRAEPVM